MTPHDLADYTYRLMIGERFSPQVDYLRRIFPLVMANFPRDEDPDRVTFSSYMVKALFQGFAVATQLQGPPKGLVTVLMPERCAQVASNLMFAYCRYVGWGVHLSSAADASKGQIAAWGSGATETPQISIMTEAEEVFYDYRLLRGLQSLKDKIDFSSKGLIVFSSQEPSSESIAGVDVSKRLSAAEVLEAVIDLPELVRSAGDERLSRSSRSGEPSESRGSEASLPQG